MQDVDEAGDVEGGEDGEDFAQVLGCDLHHLQALGYDVLVSDHDLWMHILSAAIVSLVEEEYAPPSATQSSHSKTTRNHKHQNSSCPSES